MKRAAGLFAILIALCSGLNGCAAAEKEFFQPVPLEASFSECSRPPKPEPPLLDEDSHIGSMNVLEPLMGAVDMQGAYIEALETAIDCYEQRRKNSE